MCGSESATEPKLSSSTRNGTGMSHEGSLQLAVRTCPPLVWISLVCSTVDLPRDEVMATCAMLKMMVGCGWIGWRGGFGAVLLMLIGCFGAFLLMLIGCFGAVLLMLDGGGGETGSAADVVAQPTW